ncbi:hypothetical protein [Nocardia donostiensis]|uniref:Allene oxide cyclase barrel-like domain-containing protein n=1 Tax=Nocardia donostiensis TaxID=1538463 RepID=A0A1V2TF88_9NOCA|nr:hypothetical protein [Nocardia donostiensis]ONM48176.1 hypothetical protein B0T46_14435 [Nocardia donostiensis]OQS13832.1 hypothetical protein B0T36_16945 [Nocardia donostiensis]OQS16037.1 hypothetical protein B0T44_25790 [Nocardia donostiensis]
MSIPELPEPEFEVHQCVLMVRYEPSSAALVDGSGFDMDSKEGDVTVLDDECAAAPSGVSYTSRVVMTSETTFTEAGLITLGSPGDIVHFTTVFEGVLEASAREGTLQGSVIWRLTHGEGRYVGASGLVSSMFTFQPDIPASRELQIIRLFLPQQTHSTRGGLFHAKN